MTTTMRESSTGQPDRRDIASRLLVPEFWAALSIVTMWLAVLFDGIFGGDMTKVVTRRVLRTVPGRGKPPSSSCRGPD